MNRKSTTPDIDDDTPILQSDIDEGRLIPRQRAAGRAVEPKKRVTLYLDAAVIERFKTLAGSRGYQTLINETLRESFRQTDIEAAIRKVIREELHNVPA